MKLLQRFILAVIASSAIPFIACATHNRAGEIHIRQIGPLEVEATIITWTKASSVNADRDTLTLKWGDGKRQTVWRVNGGGKGVILPNDIKYNLYVARHKYAGSATYRISMSDPNRIGGIINVDPPSSDNVPFHIETTYTFQDPQFGGYNTTPYLEQPPIDNACVGKLFKHSPNANDVDGDSLSYKLIVPLMDLKRPVPDYSFPNQVSPGPDNTLTLNERTGEILWSSPKVAGDYNLAFIVVSWRGGIPIDTTIRDMQIFVGICNNDPPKVETIRKICVIAGQSIEFPVTATDPNPGDFVQLTAKGGPLNDTIFANPATFTVPKGNLKPPVKGVFRWSTKCEHISNQPYSVVFKAVDSLDRVTPRLADLANVEIKVVGPPPEDVKAVSLANNVEISWGKPYFCENAPNKYFYGFSVWRREGSNPFMLDTCNPGLAGKGYTELIFLTKQMKDGRYVFVDNKVERGRTYCYRILAKFTRISPNGYPYNLVESLPSEEVCVQLPRDLPLITNVSIDKTNFTLGEIGVRWSKPVAEDLDTLKNPGPYRYQLLRAPGFGPGALQEVPGASFVKNNFWQANDTFFVDRDLNTLGQPWRYQVAFYTRGLSTPLGLTNTASSVFLNIISTDDTNILKWDERTPWSNYRYVVYRKAPGGQFDSIGTSIKREYIDDGLTNGKQYCYYVRSIGTYSIGGVIDPIFNNSQEVCGIPIDTVPPCAPTLTVGNLCNGEPAIQPDPPYENVLRWNNPNRTCARVDDVDTYRIWFAEEEGKPLNPLQTIRGADNTTFTHLLPDALSGCYAVTALDSVGNESRKSPTVCVDNCPTYQLPNVFTPNGDGANDLFIPFKNWRFVERIELQIFNRWGNLVFETQDPDINWNGTNRSGDELADGTYFYVCKVYEKRVEGVVLRPDLLSGFVELIRGRR
jgi:gliding motility-associated-like protein